MTLYIAANCLACLSGSPLEVSLLARLQALSGSLAADYTVVGLDRPGKQAAIPLIATDLGSDESVMNALREVRRRFGAQVASVIHLAAHFDFTGGDNPLYREVNIEGTRRLLRALQGPEVEQLIYSGHHVSPSARRPRRTDRRKLAIAPK